VQLDRIRRKEITEESQLKDKKLRPVSVPDFLALVGDTADGIPGLDGWGEKGATEVLSAHPTIPEIPDKYADWKAHPRGGEKLALVLARERENAMLYRKLATLRDDAPLKETLEQLEWKGAPKTRWEKWCDAVGADSLKTRPHKFTEG
jgi:5'-3' exonuclease